jgi:hypothetical protein
MCPVFSVADEIAGDVQCQRHTGQKPPALEIQN